MGSLLVVILAAGCGSSGNGGDEPDSSADVGEGIIVDGFDTVMSDAPREASQIDTEQPAVPAPAFAHTDRNPGSPSYEDERSLADEAGKVVLIYFANYT
jgi:hypothetical protein